MRMNIEELDVIGIREGQYPFSVGNGIFQKQKTLRFSSDICEIKKEIELENRRQKLHSVTI